MKSMKTSLFQFDKKLSRKLCVTTEKENPNLRYVFKFLEYSCHGIPWFIGVTYRLVRCIEITEFELLCNLFLALVVDILVSLVLKSAVQRERPVYNRNDMFVTVSVDKFSFPSGHATRAATLAAFFIQKVHLPTALHVSIAAWTVIVAISRVMLGRHYASDVISGYIVGLLQYFYIVLIFWIPTEMCSKLLTYKKEHMFVL